MFDKQIPPGVDDFKNEQVAEALDPNTKWFTAHDTNVVDESGQPVAEFCTPWVQSALDVDQCVINARVGQLAPEMLALLRDLIAEYPYPQFSNPFLARARYLVAVADGARKKNKD